MRIMIVAGGTGGHLYPGIAIARALQGHDVRFIVRRGDFGRDILMKEGFKAHEISGQGFPRTLSLKSLAFPYTFYRGWSQARRLLRDFQPDWVLGMGGYLSVPVIFNARLLKIRTLLHEQNVVPGLANRLLSRWSDSVAVSFRDSRAYFPQGKTWLSGLPVRAEIGTLDRDDAKRGFGFDPALPVFLVFGGSQGARRLNELFLEVFGVMRAERLAFQVLQITGPTSFSQIQRGYDGFGAGARVLSYCHTMASAYAAADWVIGRAGASTIAELLTAGRASTLVPYPSASNNHQLYNARYLEALGMADVVLEKDLQPPTLARQFKAFLEHRERQRDIEKRMAADPEASWGRGAAKRLAEFVAGAEA